METKNVQKMLFPFRGELEEVILKNGKKVMLPKDATITRLIKKANKIEE